MTPLRPKVDWYRRDLDDTSAVTVEGLHCDYARADTKPQIYPVWLPLWLLSERLWEDVDGGQYRDWSKYGASAVFPPLKIELDVVLGESMSLIHTLHIKDGNHRVRYWKKCGFVEAPAWCFDYRLPKVARESDGA